MKKYLFIAALIIHNTAWSMEFKKNSPKPINTNELTTIVPSLQKNIIDKKEGALILDTINANSGIYIPEPSLVEGNINSSNLFVMHRQQRSKL